MVLVIKNPSANAGDREDAGSIPGLERFPWRRRWQLIPVFLPGKSHGQRSLAGYSPWRCKESDMTEGLSTHTHTHTHTQRYMWATGGLLSAVGRREQSTERDSDASC